MTSPTGPKRRWVRTDATQQRILDAAVEVFLEHGFTAATISDIVARASASIGSIYYHFGGKDQIYEAMFERVAADAERRITEVAEQEHGCDVPRIFDRHARAYLEAIWAHRQASKVLSSGDWPQDFDRKRRLAMLDRFRRWAAVLDIANSKQDQVLYRVLIATMADSVTMVAFCADADEADVVIDAVVDLITRLTTPRP